MNELRESKIPLLILAGPTAVGKSTLALRLARKLNTDIISADSAQVYRELDIGTAKPTVAEQNIVRHHLINLVNPDQNYSAADFQKSADQTIREVWRNNKLPFMVGGTGLYIKAVTDRFAFGPKGADPALRTALEEITDNEGLEQLYRKLQQIDPAAAKKIHPHDRNRIIRGLEVYTLEGKPISEQVNQTKKIQSPYKPIFFALNMDREVLYRRIENRVDRMLEAGFLEEVGSLLAKGYDDQSPAMQVLGYRQLAAYMKGKMDWEETVSEIKKQTRNLAKRQLTWFRREKEITWFIINDSGDFNEIEEIIYRKVKDISP